MRLSALSTGFESPMARRVEAASQKDSSEEVPMQCRAAAGGLLNALRCEDLAKTAGLLTESGAIEERIIRCTNQLPSSRALVEF